MDAMRVLLSMLILAACCGALRAQEYVPSYGRELPQGRAAACAGLAATDGGNLYAAPLDGWVLDGNRFSAPFTVPFAWIGRQVMLHVEHASAGYEVRVNGHAVAYNSNGSAPANFNLTRMTREGANTLEIVLSEPDAAAVLESWKLPASAPVLGAVWLASRPTMYVRDVTVKTRRNNPSDDFLTAEVGIVVKSCALNPRTSRIHYELTAPDGTAAAVGHEEMTLDMRREDTIRFLARIPDSLQWCAAHPVRYALRLKTQYEGRVVECSEFRPGFRTVGTDNGVLSVNDRPVALRVCEVRPDIGAGEIEALRTKGYNALRLLPGPVSQSLFDLCDRLGLYLIVTAPVDTSRSGDSRRRGGNPSNDPAWLGAYLERAEDSYHGAKFHPSVVAFDLARRSANGINLYETYLRMKRFDEPRPFVYSDVAGEWNSDTLLTE